MHYCINSLLKNNNEIMQYCIIINDIALIMHYRAPPAGEAINLKSSCGFVTVDGTEKL